MRRKLSLRWSGQVKAEKPRVLPHNLEAERATLGGVLFSGQCYPRVAAEIHEPRDFYHPAHEAIYEAMGELAAEAQPIDSITVAQHMRKAGAIARLTAQGKETYLLELSNDVATVENIEHHARIVRDLAQIRRVILATSLIADRGYSGQFDAAQYVGEAIRDLNEAVGSIGRTRARPLKALLHQRLRALDERSQRKEAITGIRTWFAGFDEMTGGLQDGHLVVIAARPKIGKSAIAFQMAIQAQVPTIAFSLEMSADSLVDRAITQEARVDNQHFASGIMETSDWIRITRATSNLSVLPIDIDDGAAQTLAEVRNKARQWRSKHRPGEKALLVVDYMQLVVGDRRGKYHSREQEISEISRGLKALAKELSAPTIALAQVSRECEKRADKRPQLSDLRESGAIEADADLIAFLYRDEVYNKQTEDKGIAELIIAANRHGPTGAVRLKWSGWCTRFDNERSDG